MWVASYTSLITLTELVNEHIFIVNYISVVINIVASFRLRLVSSPSFFLCSRVRKPVSVNVDWWGWCWYCSFFGGTACVEVWSLVRCTQCYSCLSNDPGRHTIFAHYTSAQILSSIIGKLCTGIRYRQSLTA